MARRVDHADQESRVVIAAASSAPPEIALCVISVGLLTLLAVIAREHARTEDFRKIIAMKPAELRRVAESAITQGANRITLLIPQGVRIPDSFPLYTLKATSESGRTIELCPHGLIEFLAAHNLA